MRQSAVIAKAHLFRDLDRGLPAAALFAGLVPSFFLAARAKEREPPHVACTHLPDPVTFAGANGSPQAAFESVSSSPVSLHGKLIGTY